MRDIYVDGATSADRVRARVDDAYVRDLAAAVTGELGGKVGIAPRVFLKKLVGDVLDRVDQFEGLRSATALRPDSVGAELTTSERAHPGASNRWTTSSCERTAFDRLHPAVQYHVVNSLGWRSLRPTQLAAIGPILAGRDRLLLAPTAGGKTEAAVIPSAVAHGAGGRGRLLGVLYVCPIKALLNNLEPRLSRYAGWWAVASG